MEHDENIHYVGDGDGDGLGSGAAKYFIGSILLGWQGDYKDSC